MFHSKPFKKDIQAFAKGGKVVKHVGKGAKEQKRSSSGAETLTGRDPYAQASNNYAKPPAADFSSVGSLGGPPLSSAPPPAPVPMGPKAESVPTAMMPPAIGDGGEEEA